MRYRAYLLALLCLAAAAELSAGCAFPISGTTPQVSTINFIPLGNEPFGTTLDATSTWAFGCNGSGFYYPDLTTGAFNSAAGVMNVYIAYHTGNSTADSGRCGYTSVQVSETTGVIVGATVHMWERQANGADCTGTMDNLVAHEMGHVLGLGDAYAYSNCDGTIMGNNPSYISTDQCWALNDNWWTPEEQQEQDEYNNDMCTASCWTYCTDGFCSNQGCGSCSSPILLDLDNNGFALVGLDNRVSFDIDADGDADSITWTRGGKGDAFLVLDRNGNGTIDDGSELFGNHTPMVTTGMTALNGYEALREFDLAGMGGDGDSRIDPDDAIWEELGLWVDANHDGVSQPDELTGLTAAGVVAFETKYSRNNHRDRYGNLFRFKGRAWIVNKAGKRRASQTYDVYFQP